jgi:hypothetical protein
VDESRAEKGRVAVNQTNNEKLWISGALLLIIYFILKSTLANERETKATASVYFVQTKTQLACCSVS